MEEAHGFELNIGDIIWQLFNLGIILGVIAILVYLFISKKKQKKNMDERLDRIENKLDKLTNEK
ncbi:hypothetical protein [Bacillus suaedaesalsae]|uniref:DUF4083 domain-containing protein n=1 Tax=Bacillus suaedaesalsae TaxID=2810349 RepID=A0ABS2DM62_9BACI|nr:hypothetical protein [Bacillus suaedaesalsae]MBM6619581.1 hypothetical protein [Bacillus suaedaesalsae]